jgi:hypothetical protein
MRLVQFHFYRVNPGNGVVRINAYRPSEMIGSGFPFSFTRLFASPFETLLRLARRTQRGGADRGTGLAAHGLKGRTIIRKPSQSGATNSPSHVNQAL